MGQSTAPSLSYSSEVRFGVVMYGGVSLAIYINGVANELHEMARATPLPGSPAAGEPVRGTRRVYQWLSSLLGDEGLLRDASAALRAGQTLPDFMQAQAGRLASSPRARLVVDVIAGTSAGGINGIFLAKALANNEDFAQLKTLWIHQGDIGKLLNDEHSRDDDASLPEIASPPRSLLNSDRMYARLHSALQDMASPATAAAAPAGSAVVDELDLFVTTTDIRGATVQLRLFDKVVPERRHRQVFRLRYEGDTGHNDFQPANLDFLAYAARCTSSFPFAFEPMTLAAIERAGGRIGDREAWRRLYVNAAGADSRIDPLDRAYGDGGYLDNKPFSHAIDALSRREAEVPVERKLIYIEPSPEHPDDEDRARGPQGAPDALANALAALNEIPRRETIREDLESVLQRNRLIERVERLIGDGEADLELGSDADPYVQALARRGDNAPRWSDMTLSDLRAFYGDAFLPYRRLRVFMATDRLADRIAELWQVDPESDRLYALRALVRVWRDTHYSDTDARSAGTPTFNAYLEQYDLRFRLRRLYLLTRRVDALQRLLHKRQGERLNEPVAELSLLHGTLLQRLRRLGVDLAHEGPIHFDTAAALAALAQLRRELLQARAAARALERALAALGGPEAAQRRAALHGVLLATLDLLLGVPPAPGSLPLPEGLLAELAALSKLPSATRTLQERIYQRASLLVQRLAEHGSSPLQQALEADLALLRERIGALVDGALGRVTAQLGDPQWQFIEAMDAQGQPQALAQPVVREVGEPVLDSMEGKLLRRLLATYYLRFDSYDQMSLPLYYGSNVGEPAKVEVLRISPEDATALIDERRDPLGRRKLAGNQLANFGGFLDEQWRRNDILWGRFDGAERLIQALLPQPEHAALREALVREAHLAIAADELAPAERTEVTALMLQALQTLQADASADERLKALLGRLDVGEPSRRKQVEQALGRLLEPASLLDYVREQRDVDRRLDPERTLHQAARAITITGRLLQGISDDRKLPLASRWISRFGLMAQGLIALSVPGGLGWQLWRHWRTVLYGFGALMFGLGLLLGAESSRSLGLTVLALTAIGHLLSTGLHDLMAERGWRGNRALQGLLALLVLAIALGGLALWKLPLVCLLPWHACRLQ